MRIGVAGCFHETNTFSPAKTDLKQFHKEWIVGSEAFWKQYQGTKTSMGGAIHASNQLGFELLPLLYTQTMPSGMVSEDAAETIMQQICSMIEEAADKLDGVLLILHGAMVSEHVEDVEGELLARVRKIVGEKPIAITIDLHANVSEEMVKNADIIVGYNTYPHVDTYERALEACQLLVNTINQAIHPILHMERTNLLIVPPAMDTNVYPMKYVVDLAEELKKDQDILNISIVGGFAYADVSCAGMTIIVTTNQNRLKAEQTAQMLTKWVREHRDDFIVRPVPFASAYQQTINEPLYPTVFIESSDNVGGGSPADATHVLAQLVSERADKFLIVVADPQAVEQAYQTGLNQPFCGAVGGKLDMQHGCQPLHGKPVQLSGTVVRLFSGEYTHAGPYMSGMKANMGRTAVIELDQCPGSTVILTEERVAPWDINHIRCLQIDPEEYRIIVVKAAIAWKTAFGKIAKRSFEIDTPGCCTSNLHHLQYKRLCPAVEIVS